MQVVLPLLQNEVVTTGWVSQADFLTGLALVQAMPGPLFNFAAYLGEPPVQLPIKSSELAPEQPLHDLTDWFVPMAGTTAPHEIGRAIA